MNLQEFAALKVGDKIDNAMSCSHGTVCEVTDKGVRVRWDGVGPSGFMPAYSVAGTSWFNWSKAAMCPHGNVACTSPERCKHGDDNFQCLGGDYDAIAKGI